ncbi:uncharacterized protein LOC105191640 isoform X2 [Harpegnathos saltator]|uniref:Uncharacterized protein n=2 Tax=Harpegnathos saltator TaxID=610380 RepID=E2CAA9_HARSA|nr:uncharacterized protein LOC105191640 isoform X2 [Harpegnathos saltator]EFN75121.1 hypothetical protein EAI_04832 [Harpegnathos saltator]
MLETGRRSAISTSELGLYSDRSDRYNRNRYGLIVRKFVIGVMVVVTVILVAIFMYDFTSAMSANSKVNQETKHIYILQNALKKSPNLSKKSVNFSTILPQAIVNQTDIPAVKSRASDNAEHESPAQRNGTIDLTLPESRIMRSGELESRAQNLHNFKQRKRVLKSVEEDKENEGSEAKQLLDNHAIGYRMRQRYNYPDPEGDINTGEARPTPFHWEFKTPHPSSFKRPRYPQLSQYRYPQSSRNIQDIIKYLTNDAEMPPNRGIKFTGVYVNPKKYDLFPGIGEMMSGSDKSEEDVASPYPVTYHNDPFYQYKPKHPADVNLLAPSNVRFSPTGIHRYNPYYDSLYSRPLFNKPIGMEPQYENAGAYSTNTLGKNRKPKPFSVMLDIYPITDIMEQNKKPTWSRPADDYDSRRPLQFTRGPKLYGSSPQPPVPLVAMPSPTTLPEEEERQQMIFHLNLYPRRKNKLNRHDIIHKSESMGLKERQEFAEKIMSPLESIAKHLTDHSAIEQSKFEENENPETTNLPLTRYHEINLDDKDEKDGDLEINKDSETYPDPSSEGGRVEENVTVPSNHKLNVDEDYTSTKKFEVDLQKTMKFVKNDCANCDNATAIDDPKTSANKSADLSKDVDTVEGFQRFSDGLLRSDWVGSMI